MEENHGEYGKTRMVQLMLEKMDKRQPIVVETFRQDDAKGIAPRAFYKKIGFVEGELAMLPDEYPVQKFYYKITIQNMLKLLCYSEII